jgi:hypothetical protein
MHHMTEPLRYPSFVRGPASGPRLVWQNDALMAALQASQGLIGPEVVAMSVEATTRSIVLHVCLRELNELVEDDLDELLGDLEALTGGYVEPSIDLGIATFVGDSVPEWPGYSHPRLSMMSVRAREADRFN